MEAGDRIWGLGTGDRISQTPLRKEINRLLSKGMSLKNCY